jgi:hypothetical protein
LKRVPTALERRRGSSSGWDEYKRRRPDRARQYASSAWRRRSAEHMKANPICVGCGARASVADHILAVGLGGAFDGPLQSCAATATSERHSRIPTRRGDAVDDDEGWVHVGDVVVETGQVAIVDPALADEVVNLEGIDDILVGAPGLIVSSGLGDGIYPVEVMYKDLEPDDRRIAAVMVTFL